jgi:phosphatidylglycerophosphate synthase
MATGHFGLAALMGILVGLADILDGQLARRLGTSSDAGEIIDAAVDRYTEFAALAGLTIYYRQHWPFMLLTLGAMLGCIMISYSSAKAETLHIELPKGLMRRAERTFFINSGAVAVPVLTALLPPSLRARPEICELPLLLAVGAVAVLANVSAVLRFRHIVQGARQLAARPSSPTSFKSESPASGSAHAV